MRSRVTRATALDTVVKERSEEFGVPPPSVALLLPFYDRPYRSTMGVPQEGGLRRG